jgi:sugar phosphate isomerase/epimerase
MKMDRRSFVKVAAGAAIGGMVGIACRKEATLGEEPQAAPALRSLERIGVQLYSVRYLMEQDFAGTLAAVAAAGYDEVEFAGYFDKPAKEVRAILDGVGLDAPASHVSIDALRNDLAGTIAAAATVGHRYLVCPWIAEQERTLVGYQQIAAFFNEVGGACREAGMRFGYHNHDFEFSAVDGRIPMELLIEETDAELVDIELDLFWIQKGGEDTLAYFERYPGRFSLCHVKDMTAEGEMVGVGEGQMDFAAIFARSEQAGLRHYFVEHDNPADPLASITASQDHLRALQF